MGLLDKFKSGWDYAQAAIDPSTGYETASKGAQKASDEYKKLAEEQWRKQMEGLGLAQAMLQPYQSLYDQIYHGSAFGFGPKQGQQPPVQAPSQQFGQRPGPSQQFGPPPQQNMFAELLRQNRMR